jgi:glycosyltransferase involved in cell wall biosynthesis
MAGPHKVSAVIITFNCDSTIRATLDALGWCDEIVVVDSGSTDNTKEICIEHSCKFSTHVFEGYGAQKQYATGLAVNDWILSVDGDEVLSAGLQEELKLLFEQEEIPYPGFMVPISLVFMGRIFRFGQEANQLHLRLFNRRHGGFDAAAVHEKVHIRGEVKRLKNTVYHFSHKDIAHYFEKFNRYTSVAAEEAVKNNRKAGVLKIAVILPITFILKYFIRLNFLNGFAGLAWSALAAYYSFVKYLKIYEQSSLKER